MVRSILNKVRAAALFLLLQRVRAACPPKYPAGLVIERDVLILGGGAAGAYSAVRLKDEGKTFAVIEREDKLGGHVDTFFVPGGGPIEYGVQAYIDNNQTRDFFGRFGVGLNASGLSPFPSVLADFTTGFVIPNATAPSPFDYLNPLINFLGTVSSLFPFLAEGAYDIPSPVPEDLVLPFGQFAAKYNLTEVVPVMWIFVQGVGNLLDATTLDVLQNFGQAHIAGLAAGYLYAPAGAQTVYDLAAQYIGTENIFFNSKALKVVRSDAGVEVTVNGAIIKAKKLLVTIPPTLGNLAPFDLTEAETAVFSRWTSVPYYVGVTSGTGLADLTNYLNTNVSSPFGLPTPPFLWRFETPGQPGYQIIKVIGEPSSDAAKDLVSGALTRLTGSPAVTYEAWEEHDNLQLHFSVDDIRSGIYNDLYALQGQKSTIWVGNAWCSDYSPLIWQFIEKRTLPALLQ